MIFTQAGHISKGLTVSWIGNHSAPTLVSRVTHTAGECLRRAFVLGPLLSNLPSSSSLTEEVVSKRGGRQKGALSGQDWPSGEVKVEIEISQPRVRQNTYRKTQRCICTAAVKVVCAQNVEPIWIRVLVALLLVFSPSFLAISLNEWALCSLCSVSLCVLLDNRLLSLDHGRPTCTQHTAGQSGVYSSSPVCLLKLRDDIADIKKTFTVSTPWGKQNEGLREPSKRRKCKSGSRPLTAVCFSHCRLFPPLSANVYF